MLTKTEIQALAEEEREARELLKVGIEAVFSYYRFNFCLKDIDKAIAYVRAECERNIYNQECLEADIYDEDRDGLCFGWGLS